MPGICRLRDKARAPTDTHGGQCCSSHINVEGPATTAARTVYANSRQVVRKTDRGVHRSCCGPNTWEVVDGSGTVFVENQNVARIGDPTRHCGGAGEMIEGSQDVFVGD